MNKNKGFISIGLILAIVLGIVVVGGGAYYLGKSGVRQEVKNPENILPNNENQNLPVIDNKQTNNVSSLVTVLSPNGGEVYKNSDKISIKWKGIWKDRIAIYLRFSSGEWCSINEVSSSNTNYTFTPFGHECGDGRGVISGVQKYKITLISYDSKGMAPDPGMAFAVEYNDGNDGVFNVESSDNYFTINSTKVVSLDMSSELARTYTTAFTNALKQPANFNGHYVVASWGCGSGCLGYGIVDKLTGKAYQGPSDDYGNTAGYSGDADFNTKRWLVSSNVFKAIGRTSIEIYTFDNEKFTKTGSTPFPKN